MTQAETPTFSAPPFPVDPLALNIPNLPAELEGIRILHLSDTHVRSPRPRHEAILAAVAQTPHDLLAITGDMMVDPGDEPAAHGFMVSLARYARPRLGIVGIFGNHDSPDLRRRLAPLPIHWLNNSAWAVPRLPLTLLGVDCVEGEHSAPAGDLLAAVMEGESQAPDASHRCRILLSHMPIWLPAAADVGLDLMLCGHTHAGQCRLPNGRVFYNATPGWPHGFSSGLLRCRQTKCLISRGLGEVYVQGLRFFCKPQLPLITLHRAEKPPKPASHIIVVRKW